MEELRRRPLLYYGLLALVLLACVWLLWELRFVWQAIGAILSYVLTPFLIAVVIAYLLNPLVARLHKRGVPRGTAIVIIYFVFFLFLTAALLNAIPLLIEQLREFGEQIPHLFQQVETLMDSFNEDTKQLPEAVRKALNSNLSGFESKITASITKVMETAGNTLEIVTIAFVIPFLVFYMLKDVKGIERAIVAFFPAGNRSEILRLIKSIDEALGNYIRGQLFVSFVIGVLAYLGYWIVHMPYALLLALIVAVTNVIPYIGPFIGAAPGILLAFTVSPMMALKVAIVNVIIQQLEGNLIGPYLIGRSLKLHPMLIIFAVLLGGELFGVAGLILAIPVVAVGKVLLQHLVLHWIKR